MCQSPLTDNCFHADSSRKLSQTPVTPATGATPATPATPATSGLNTTPLRYNATLLGISEISNEQADSIKAALNMTFSEPYPADIVVSSNTSPEDDRLTLIILVYPRTAADTKHLQTVLQETDTQPTFLRNLVREAELPVTNVQVNSVTLQGNTLLGGNPVTGSSLAGEQCNCQLSHHLHSGDMPLHAILHSHFIMALCVWSGRSICYACHVTRTPQ